MKLLRKVFGLPKKKKAGGEEFADALASRSRRKAGEQPEADTTEDAATAQAHAPARRPDTSAWAEEDEGSGSVFARRTGRIAVWAVIGLFAFIGVRSVIAPQQPTATPKTSPQTEAAKDDVPDAAAQQVAARFARSYLTWSQDDPASRATELARDLPKGADTKAGWDGHGLQLVAQTIPGEVTQTSAHQARVSVDVRVSSTQGAGSKAKSVSSWVGLEVPVAEAGARVIVTGQPALVGLAQPVTWEEPGSPDTDAALSERTRTTVANFFEAWVDGTADQSAAPGAKIAPLSDGLAWHSLDTWALQTGSGSRRTGLATVRWELAGAELQQTYRVTLTQVSADGASRWQVWLVTSQ
ncbi:conjugal transfer protein [Streptomyces prunicolor]|uniref:conjugal transfer protein n=1 Tax=Streptomyces prunicolor TaxID=67348 RepID=UPI00037DFFC0|nr:conjugal transfer protein [Streptomyces prunicolor]